MWIWKSLCKIIKKITKAIAEAFWPKEEEAEPTSDSGGCTVEEDSCGVTETEVRCASMKRRVTFSSDTVDPKTTLTCRVCIYRDVKTISGLSDKEMSSCGTCGIDVCSHCIMTFGIDTNICIRCCCPKFIAT